MNKYQQYRRNMYIDNPEWEMLTIMAGLLNVSRSTFLEMTIKGAAMRLLEAETSKDETEQHKVLIDHLNSLLGVE